MKTLLFLFLGFSHIALLAQPSLARIDIDASGAKIFVTNLRPLVSNAYVRPATWGSPEYRAQFVNAEFTLKPGVWNELVWQFTPLRDGRASLNAMGPWYKPQGASNIVPIWVYLDDFSATGTSLSNAGFEDLDEKGLPKGWSLQREGKLVSDARFLKSGKHGVKVSHDHRFTQLITLKSNQAVTLRAWAFIEPQAK